MKLIKEYNELDQDTKYKLLDVVNNEFGDVPIVTEYEWAIPDWAIILYSNDEIATVAHVVSRTSFFDNEEVKAGGLNNMITVEQYRGKGFAEEVLKSTHELIFEKLQVNTFMYMIEDLCSVTLKEKQ